MALALSGGEMQTLPLSSLFLDPSNMGLEFRFTLPAEFERSKKVSYFEKAEG